MATDQYDHITQTEQNILNKSQDTTFKVLAFEMLGYNPTASTLNRIRVNASGEMYTVSGGSFTTFVSTAVTLTSIDTAYLLPSSEQSSRTTLVVYNKSDTDVYIGSSSVTTSTGILLPAGGQMSIDAESGVYAVCGVAGKIVNTLEMN